MSVTENCAFTVASTESIGGDDWTNPNNAKVVGGGTATTGALDGFSNPFSDQLKLITPTWPTMTAFCTLISLTLTIKRQAGTASKITDQNVRLIIGGVEVGIDMADPSTFYPTGLTDKTYNVLTLSGETPTCAQLVAADTGFLLVSAFSGIGGSSTVGVDVGYFTATFDPPAAGSDGTESNQEEGALPPERTECLAF